MAKKRKVSGRNGTSESINGFEPKGGKMGAITTYEDVANSEDEFHINRDKVMLDDGPEAKRRRKWQEEDAFLEPSDEEILGYSSESEDEAPRKKAAADVSDEEEVEQEEEDVEGWGASKKDYYNHDEILTEADALEEEKEARRLQQKRLAKMSDADFRIDDFDEDEWVASAKNDEDDGDVVIEVLKDVEITPDMNPEERMRILQTRYPEFNYLADEFLKWAPILSGLQAQEESTSKSQNRSVTVIKSRALAAYVATLSMYFALLTSPAKDGSGKTMDPAELRDHSVMDSLLECRKLWMKVKDLKSNAPTTSLDQDNESSDENPQPSSDVEDQIEVRPSKRSRKERARLKAAEEAAALREQQMEDAEKQLADLSSLIPKARKSSKKKTTKAVVVADDDSDFGEEESMDAKSAAEKAQKKKSLRFYTSQIAQKANKRADAGRDAGGDADLPHRERLRDRQARLNAEAEKRGKKLDEYGRGGAATALGGDSDSGEDEAAVKIRDEGDEYYDMVAKTSKKKKDEKQERMDAIKKAKAEGAMVRVVEGEVDEDGKRAIGYVIEKNKGLAPKRKKDVRNPRVKKRKKFEEKKKKLASTRAVYKGGEERGGYGGEKTGIKAGIVKSIKLG